MDAKHAMASLAFRATDTTIEIESPKRDTRYRRKKTFRRSNSLEIFKNHESNSPQELAAKGRLDDLKAFIESFGLTLKETDESGASLLHHATANNQVQVMEYLIESGAGLNLVDIDGNTALHVAVQNSHIEAMHLLLKYEADDTILNKNIDAPIHIAMRSSNTDLIAGFLEHPVDLTVQGYRKRTPLHVLAECDNREGFEVFINSQRVVEACTKKSPVRLCAADADELTPIHLAARCNSYHILDSMISKTEEFGYPKETVLGFLDEENSTPLHAAVDAGHAEVVEVLLKHQACPLASKDNQPPSLHLACSQGKLGMVQSMVKHCGKQILTHPDQHNRTPLHYSTHPINSARMILYILASGAEVDAVDSLGRTPLHSSIASGSHEAVKELLSHKANPFIKEQRGFNALHFAVIRNRKAILNYLMELPYAAQLVMDVDHNGDSPIHLALKLGHSELVAPMISVIRSQLQNIRDANGNNYLHLAADSKNWKALSVLLDIPSCLTLLNETNNICGMTPLHYAAMSGCVKCTEILLSHGAMLHKCHAGGTPFMAACWKGHEESARALYNAHPFQKDWSDDQGNTALHAAALSGNPSCVNAVLDIGVQVTRNYAGVSFFDILIERVDTECAMVVINHDRWQECLDLSSSCYPHPMIGLVTQMPDVARAVLNRCHTKASIDKAHPDYWERFNFKYLRLQSGPSEFIEEDGSESEDLDFEEDSSMDIESPIVRYKGSVHQNISPSKAKKQVGRMEVLTNMVKYKRTPLLIHPVVENYLMCKWKSYGRWIHLGLLLLNIIHAVFLAAFVIVARDSSSISNNTKHLLANHTALNASNSDSGTASLGAAANALRILTLILNCIGTINLFSVAIGRKQFAFISFTVLIMTLTSLFNFIFLIPSPPIWGAGALATFFTWFGVVLSLQFFDIFGIYVRMFLTITRTACQVLLISILFLTGFALSLYILAHTVPEFSNLGFSLFTMFGYMLGAVQYDLFVAEDIAGNLPNGVLTFLFVIVLAILMSIVMANLLIGLAVGDIEIIRRNAIAEKRRLEVLFFTRIDDGIPERVIKKVDVPFYKKYPNERVSLIKSPLRYIWKSFKDNSFYDDNDDEQNTGSMFTLKNSDSMYQEFAGMRQSVDELTELVKHLHTTQQQSRPQSALSFDSDII